MYVGGFKQVLYKEYICWIQVKIHISDQTSLRICNSVEAGFSEPGGYTPWQTCSSPISPWGTSLWRPSTYPSLWSGKSLKEGRETYANSRRFKRYKIIKNSAVSNQLADVKGRDVSWGGGEFVEGVEGYSVKPIPSNAHISTPFFHKTVFFSKIFFGKSPSKFLEVWLNSEYMWLWSSVYNFNSTRALKKLLSAGVKVTSTLPNSDCPTHRRIY